MFQQGKKKKELFTWTLQVLRWTNWTALAKDPSYEKITTSKDYYSPDDHNIMYNITLNKTQCTARSFLLANLSSTVYYKFQIMVEKHKKVDNYVAKNVFQNGSYIHYFGKLS